MNLENSLMGNGSTFENAMRQFVTRLKGEILNCFCDIIRLNNDQVVSTSLTTFNESLDRFDKFRLEVSFDGPKGVYRIFGVVSFTHSLDGTFSFKSEVHRDGI